MVNSRFSAAQHASFLAVIALFSGCAPKASATAQTPPQIVFLVFDPVWETSPALAEAKSDSFIKGFATHRAIRVVRTDQPASCTAEPDCLAQQAQTSGAQKAVSVRLAGLGDTVLLRATVWNGKLGTEENTRQATLSAVDQPSLDSMLTKLGAELAAPYAPKPSPPVPLTRSPWFWGAMTLVVVGGAVAVGGAIWASQPKVDVVITPP